MYMKTVREFNANVRSNHTLKTESSYQCLGKQNIIDEKSGRSCLFKNLCYDRQTNDYIYFQQYKISVFYDRRKGPLFTFSNDQNDFIQMTALFYGHVQSFSPVIKYKAIPVQDVTKVRNLHVLWSRWSTTYNLGHLIYEELGSAYFAMKRFGIYNKTSCQLLDFREKVIDKLYNKIVKAFGQSISSNPVKFQGEYYSEFSTRYICFDELLVAGASRFFLSAEDNMNGGYEPLLYEFRNDVLRSFNLDPFTIPSKHKIIIIQKSHIQNKRQSIDTRTLSREIFNVDEVYEFIRNRWKNIVVDIISPQDYTIEKQLQMMLEATIVITPCGGISMLLPFLPHNSHAIIMDYYGEDVNWMNTQQGESSSMEVSFWNLWPHFVKQYYQIMEKEADIVPDFIGSKNTRDGYSVKINLERIEFMINVALIRIGLAI
jgi:hypothetical protein